MAAYACCCCGAALHPRRPQWPNQDTGYGLCDECAAMILHLPGFRPLGRYAMPIDEFERCYGKDGRQYVLPNYRTNPALIDA